MLGTTELLLLGGLALLVFGGKKVPEMMRGLGQGVKEFKKGMTEDEKLPNANKEVVDDNGHRQQNQPQGSDIEKQNGIVDDAGTQR